MRFGHARLPDASRNIPRNPGKSREILGVSAPYARESQRGVLYSLPQPIESGEAVVARANAHVRFPARFQLVAAMNPCRCGYLSDPAQACARAPKCAQDYQSRVSGPLFDRI